MKSKNSDVFMQDKAFGWVALATGIILMIPLLAMQFSDEVNWTLADFIIAGILLFGFGSGFVLTARKIRKYRAVLALVFAALLSLIWIELAVGLFTDWGS